MEEPDQISKKQKHDKQALKVLVIFLTVALAGYFVSGYIINRHFSSEIIKPIDYTAIPQDLPDYEFVPELDTKNWDEYNNERLGIAFKTPDLTEVKAGEVFTQLAVIPIDDEFGNPIGSEYFSMTFKFRPDIYEAEVRQARSRLGRENSIKVSKIVIDGIEGTVIEIVDDYEYYREFFIPFDGMTLYISTYGEKQKIDNLIKSITFSEPTQYIIRYTWPIYTDEDLGLQFNYPPDWEVVSSSNSVHLRKKDSSGDIYIEKAIDEERIALMTSGVEQGGGYFADASWKGYFFEGENPGEPGDTRDTRVYVGEYSGSIYFLRAAPSFDYDDDAIEDDNYFQIFNTIRYLEVL
jgi:hypothetical protein